MVGNGPGWSRKLPSPPGGAGPSTGVPPGGGRSHARTQPQQRHTEKGRTLSSNAEPPADGRRPADGPGLPDGFLFGVATAGFQVEGGFNGPGEPTNNWVAWEQVGRVAPSGDAVGFWDRPEEALDRAAALGCNSFRLGVEWARVFPDHRRTDATALARYADIVRAADTAASSPW